MGEAQLRPAMTETLPRRASRDWRRTLSTIRKAPILPVGILVVVAIAAILAPMISPHNPGFVDLRLRTMPPFWEQGGDPAYPLGTDYLGRDMLSRLVWGARISLIVGALSILFAGGIGTFLGLLSGYFGGLVDTLIMRACDIQMSVPPILLALLLAAVLKPGLGTVIIVIAVVYWTGYARISRGEVLSLRQRDFVALAKVGGCRSPRILARHILPNIVNTLIVLSTVQLGGVIIYEASLSFLGLGVQPPDTSWGMMLSEGRNYMTVGWWLVVLPGLAIMFTVLGANMLGDWMRDALDPRRRQL